MAQHFLAAVVEDDLFTRKILLRYFSRHGLDCKGFESGEELLSHLGKQPFTHVITDVNLGGISGYEIGEILQTDFPEITRIVMTSPNDSTEIDSFLDKGFDDVLLKPVSEEDLLEVIQMHKAGFQFPTLDAMIEDPKERKEILHNLVSESRLDAGTIRNSMIENNGDLLLLLVHRFVGRLAQFDQNELSSEFRKLESGLLSGIPIHALVKELELAVSQLIDFTDALEAEIHSMP